jgi:hypothetical protein
MKKKELLNEIMGVPKAITPWVNSIVQIIYDDVLNFNTWDEEGPVFYTDNEGEEVEGTAVRMDEREISGKEVMDSLVKVNGFKDLKEFTQSEMFKKYPLWRPTVTYRLVGIPEELYNKETDGKVNARVGSNDNGLSTVGKLKVLPSVEMYFDILSNKELPLGDLKQNLTPTVAHELLHMYQKLKQLEGGHVGHFGDEGFLNAMVMNPLLDEIKLDWWKDFLNLVYLHLSFEVNARVTQFYYLLQEKNVETKEDFLRELKNSSMWRQMKRLENFNAEEYIKTFKVPSLKDNPFEMLDSLLKKTELMSRGVNVKSKEKMLKSLIDLWDKALTIGNLGMEQMGLDVTMDSVPKKAKESPLKFFKFFENRFHRKAEKWKKKLYKIGALVLQEKEEALQKNK